MKLSPPRHSKLELMLLSAFLLFSVSQNCSAQSETGVRKTAPLPAALRTLGIINRDSKKPFVFYTLRPGWTVSDALEEIELSLQNPEFGKNPWLLESAEIENPLTTREVYLLARTKLLEDKK